MPRNGSGGFSLPSADFPAVPTTLIESSKFNNVGTDIEVALTDSISKNGETIPTADLPMGGKNHTNVGDADLRNEYASLGQTQDQSFLWCGTAGGTANAITLSPAPGLPAYKAGQVFRFKSGASANTGAVTFAISGLAAIAGQVLFNACDGHEMAPNQLYTIVISPGLTTCQIIDYEKYISVSKYATSGDGSVSSKWAGWETGIESVNSGSLVHFEKGNFSQTVQVDYDCLVKKGLTFSGDGKTSSIISVSGAISSFVFSSSALTDVSVLFKELTIIGDPSLSLDLVKFTKVNQYTFKDCTIRSTSKSCVSVDDNGINGSFKDVTIESFKEHGIKLTNASSIVTIDGVLSAANGVTGGISLVYVDNSEAVSIERVNINGENIIGGILLTGANGASRLALREVYAENLIGSAVKSTSGGIINGLIVDNANIHTTDSTCIDLSPGNPAHKNIHIRNVRRPVSGAGTLIFNPGTGIESFTHESGDLGTAGGGYVNGYELDQNYIIKTPADITIQANLVFKSDNQKDIGEAADYRPRNMYLANNLTLGNQVISTLATGTAPLSITSRTPVANLLVEGVDVVATGSLPAAGASQNGKVLIEDAGAGNRNLIIYGGGERFRIDGGAAF